MTSPADQMRERLRKLFDSDEWLEAWSQEAEVEILLTFAQSVEQAALMEAAKAVCSTCANSQLPKATLFGSVWGHSVGSENYVHCKAAAIHSLRREAGGPERQGLVGKLDAIAEAAGEAGREDEKHVNYVQEVRGDLDGPSCHVCGAVMVKQACGRESEFHWRCLSCGEHIPIEPTGGASTGPEQVIGTGTYRQTDTNPRVTIQASTGEGEPRCPKCGKGKSLVIRDYDDGLRLVCGANCGLIVDVDAATGLEFSLTKFAQFFRPVAAPVSDGPRSDLLEEIDDYYSRIVCNEAKGIITSAHERKEAIRKLMSTMGVSDGRLEGAREWLKKGWDKGFLLDVPGRVLPKGQRDDTR